MSAVAQRFISEEEFQQIEAKSTQKHEYYQGQTRAMSGGSNSHAVLCANATATLVSRLRGKSCMALGSEQRVKVEATGLQTYPDALVYCPPARFEGKNKEVLLTPQLIIEVLSPSTESYDRMDKFNAYKQIKSLTDYILVAQNRVWVEHYVRGEGDAWTVRSYAERAASLLLPELGIELPLEKIYERLDVPEGVRLLPEGSEEEPDAE